VKIKSKKHLGILLSKLKHFEKPKIKLEQYETPPEIAADIIWNAHQIDGLKGKKVFDMGCGTGILSIGAALLGADVIGYDVDKDAIRIAKENARKIGVKVKFLVRDIKEIYEKPDIIIQNPPFGTKGIFLDALFLEKALFLSPIIYTLHPSIRTNFIKAISKAKGFSAQKIAEYKMPMKPTQPFHRKRVHYQKVILWRLEKLQYFKN